MVVTSRKERLVIHHITDAFFLLPLLTCRRAFSETFASDGTHSLNRPTKTVVVDAHENRVQSSVDQMLSPLDVTKGQRRGGVGGYLRLSADQPQCQFGHSWRPIMEVGHDQPQPGFPKSLSRRPPCVHISLTCVERVDHSE